METNINYFEVMENGTLVICTGSEIVYVEQGSSSPQKYDVGNTISENSVFKSDVIYDGIYGNLVVYDLNKIKNDSAPDKITINKTCLLEKNYQVLQAASTDYLAWLNVKDKNKLTLIDRIGYGAEECKTIDLDNTAFFNNDAPLEDVKGGVRVISNDSNAFYFLVMKNKVIQVYELKL